MNLFIIAFLYLGTAIGIIKVTMSAASAITKVMIQNITGTHTQDKTTLLGSGSANKAQPSEVPKLDPNEEIAKQQENVSTEQNKDYKGENFNASKIRIEGEIGLNGSIAVDKNIGTAADVNILNANYLNQERQNLENFINKGQKIKISGPMELGTFDNGEINGGKRFTLALENNSNRPQDSTLGLNVNKLNAKLNLHGKNINRLNAPAEPNALEGDVNNSLNAIGGSNIRGGDINNSLNAPEGTTLNIRGENINSNLPKGTTLNIREGDVNNSLDAIEGSNIRGGDINNSLNAPEGTTLNIRGEDVNNSLNAIEGSNIRGGDINNSLDESKGTTLNIRGEDVNNSLNAPEGTTLNIREGDINNSLNAPEGTTLNIRGEDVNNSLNAIEGSNIRGGDINNSLNAPEGTTLNALEASDAELNEQGESVNAINVSTESALGENYSHVNKLNNPKKLTLNVRRLDSNFYNDVIKQIDSNPETILRSGNRRKIRPPEIDLLGEQGNRFFAKENIYHYLKNAGNFGVYRRMPRALPEFLEHRRFSDLRTRAFGAGLTMGMYAKLKELNDLLKNESIGVQSSSETGLQESAAMASDDTIHQLNDPEFRGMMRTMVESNPDVDPESFANMIMMAKKLLEKRKTMTQNYENPTITSGKENVSQLAEKRLRTVEKQDDDEKKKEKGISEAAARREAIKNVRESSGSAIDMGTRLKIAASTLFLKKKDVLQQDEKFAINEKLNSINSSQNITKEEKNKLRKVLTDSAIDTKLAEQALVIQKAIDKDPEGTRQILGDDLYEKIKKLLEKLDKSKNKEKKQRNKRDERRRYSPNPNPYANLGDNNLNDSTEGAVFNFLRTVDVDSILKDIRKNNDKNNRVEGNSHNV